MNAPKPGLTRTEERLAEIAKIPAAGLMRPKGRQSSLILGPRRKSSLDCPDRQSSDFIEDAGAFGGPARFR
jgi:hypothetical protein